MASLRAQCGYGGCMSICNSMEQLSVMLGTLPLSWDDGRIWPLYHLFVVRDVPSSHRWKGSFLRLVSGVSICSLLRICYAVLGTFGMFFSHAHRCLYDSICVTRCLYHCMFQRDSDLRHMLDLIDLFQHEFLCDFYFRRHRVS